MQCRMGCRNPATHTFYVLRTLCGETDSLTRRQRCATHVLREYKAFKYPSTVPGTTFAWQEHYVSGSLTKI